MAASLTVLLFSWSFFDLEIDFRIITWIFFFGSSALAIGVLRLKWSSPIGPRDVFFLLAADIVFISLLVHVTGGIANPFSSFILVPLALSIVLLALKLSSCLVVISGAIYGYWTLNMGEHAHHRMSFELHLYGMWANFLLSAVLLFLFISYVMNRLREKENQLRITREKILKDEQLVGIATLTANTAHSMGTPLSTMQILLEDVDQGHGLSDKALYLLRDQVEVCRQYLAGLVNAARTSKIVDYDQTPIDQLKANLQQHVNLLFPERRVDFTGLEVEGDTQVKYSQTLFFAIANILDNAIQSAEDLVKVVTAIDGHFFKITIEDDGPGLKSEDRVSIEQPFLTESASGMGVGLFLTNSTIEQAGGNIQIQDRIPHGTIFTIAIPLGVEVKQID